MSTLADRSYVPWSGESLAGQGHWTKGRPKCKRCGRWLARASDMCGHCGRCDVIVGVAAMGITERDRLDIDENAGWIPAHDNRWERQEAAYYRQLWEDEQERIREDERIADAIAAESLARYGEPVSDPDDPRALAVLNRIRQLEAQLDAERADLRAALVEDRANGWSMGRLAERLDVTRQRIAQLVPGGPRQRSVRRKR